MLTPINNKALMKLLYIFGGLSSLVTVWVSWMVYDSISHYRKYIAQAASESSNKPQHDIEYYLRVAGHASLILWVFIFTLRVSELKIHGMRLRIRGAVVRKTADLSR